MGANISLRNGTACGTVLSVLPNLLSEDVLRTIILAAVGAVASTVVTLAVKALANWYDQRRGQK